LYSSSLFSSSSFNPTLRCSVTHNSINYDSLSHSHTLRYWVKLPMHASALIRPPRPLKCCSSLLPAHQQILLHPIKS
jgi:hypothetical protein